MYTFMWQVRFFFHFSQMPRRVQKRRHLCRPRSLPLLPRLLGEKLQDCSVRSTLSGNKYFIQQRLANARTFVAERRKMQAETGSPEKLRSWSPRRRRLPKKERDQVHHGLQVQDGVLRQPVPAPVVVTEVPFCVLKGGGGGCVLKEAKDAQQLSSFISGFLILRFWEPKGGVGRRRENYWSAGDGTFVRVYAVCAGNGRNEGRRNCAHVRACLCLLVWKYIAPAVTQNLLFCRIW